MTMAERVTFEKNSSEVDKDNEKSSVDRKERTNGSEGSDEETKVEAEPIPDCPVCLQTCSYPVKLACGHIFCFLCIKGVVFRSKRCAMCRQDVDLNYFESPVVVKFSDKTAMEGVEEETVDTSDKYQWYYEGRNGWWQYDESSSAELEKAHKDCKRSCELLIAGFLYFVDFENMVQFRKTEPGRRRRIKRDVIDAEKKGVAGLRVQHEGNRRMATASRTNSNASSDNHGQTFRRSWNRQRSETPSVVEALPVNRLVIGSSSDDDTPAQRNSNASS